jgi:hypothetical protein
MEFMWLTSSQEKILLQEIQGLPVDHQDTSNKLNSGPILGEKTYSETTGFLIIQIMLPHFTTFNIYKSAQKPCIFRCII